MSKKVIGNLSGLSSREIRDLEKLFSRNFYSSEIIGQDLARELCLKADILKRKLALLVDRNAKIIHVIVGKNDLVYLPDLGRVRTGAGGLRKLRLIQTEFTNRPEIKIASDTLTDLEKLRLDSVAIVKLERSQVRISWAYLNPHATTGEVTYTIEEEKFWHQLDFNYQTWIQDLEQEFSVQRKQSKVITNDRALIVGVYPKGSTEIASRVSELKELARTAGVEIVGEYLQQRKLDPKTLVGKGKITEITLEALRLDANLLIFDRELTPGQWRSITGISELKVIDRSMLILDIFALRAKSSDGKLQVELAQLKYNLPKLVDLDSGLSRLSGGIGGRGPGETKLEVSRRYYRDRIRHLEMQIDQLSKQRELRRKKRTGVPIKLVALVGYTNVGKSSLFNALTKAEAFVENKLFATLDPTQRKLYLEHYNQDNEEGFQYQSRQVVLIDTVGFIRDLPKELTKAFRATLEEIGQADLVLHVHDASDPSVKNHHLAVEKQLEEAGYQAVPRLNVFNKTDLVVDEEITAVFIPETNGIAVSALKRKNFEELKVKIYQVLFAQQEFLPLSSDY